MKVFRTLLFSLLFFVPSRAFACPLIDGLIDVNCDQVLKIGFVGDSFVKGVGDRSQIGGGYVTRIGQLFPNAVLVKYPKPGIISGRLLSRLMRVVPGMHRGPAEENLFDTDYLIIDVGRNDYWEDNFPPNTINNIKRMVVYLRTQLSRNGRVPPVIGVNFLAKTTRRFQAGFIENVNFQLLKQRTASRLPAYLRMDKLSESGISKDGLHPRAVGYDRMAKVIKKFLETKAQSLARRRATDADQDGIFDSFEVSKFGTSPSFADTDGDTFLDGEEVFTYETDPLDPSSFPAPN